MQPAFDFSVKATSGSFCLKKLSIEDAKSKYLQNMREFEWHVPPWTEASKFTSM